MTKKNENEPEDKARRRLNEFNRQRQAVPDEKEQPDQPAGEKEAAEEEDSAEDQSSTADEKKLNSLKK
jgi:hypothetical protein